jgi:hypothetical protein
LGKQRYQFCQLYLYLWSGLLSLLNEKAKDAVLNWSTSWEQNNHHFEVERSIAGLPDGFNKLEDIAGKGSVVSVASYTYTDYSPVESGTVIYRLKQVDNNGAFDYSACKKC